MAEPTSCQMRHGKAKNNYVDMARSWRIVTAGHLGARGPHSNSNPNPNPHPNPNLLGVRARPHP